MKIRSYLNPAALALAALLAAPWAEAEMAPMDAAEMAAWAEAYASIQSMTPRFAVQTAEKFKDASDFGGPVVYLDVRTPAEWEKGWVPGATKVTLTDLATPDGAAMLPADKTAVIGVYCRSGHRSALAIPLLHRMGYVNAISIRGGYKAWVDAGYPIEGASE